MTIGDTILAVLYALCIWRILDLTVDYGFKVYRRKKLDRILEELDEFWELEAAKAKPARKKAVAKKK
jgi:hypothetical protein